MVGGLQKTQYSRKGDKPTEKAEKDRCQAQLEVIDHKNYLGFCRLAFVLHSSGKYQRGTHNSMPQQWELLKRTIPIVLRFTMTQDLTQSMMSSNDEWNLMNQHPFWLRDDLLQPNRHQRTSNDNTNDMI